MLTSCFLIIRIIGSSLRNLKPSNDGETPAAAEADNQKLRYSQLQIIGIKRKICVFTNLAQMLPFVFLRIGGKLHFRSLTATV